MELCSLSVTGFRRFRKTATLQTQGKLVALVGPNEAGKSSLLEAIAMVAHNNEPNPGDFARGEDRSRFKIEARYFLSDEDRTAAGGIEAKWLKLEKGPDGRRNYEFQPKRPTRSLQPRRLLHDAIEMCRTNRKFRPRLEEAELLENIDSAIAILSSASETLKAGEIETVLADLSPVLSQLDAKDAASLRKLPMLLATFESSERAKSPSVAAWEALQDRLPEILVFGEDARNLASEYSIAALREAVPLSLSNLCRVAKLDLPRLLQIHGEGDAASVTTLEHQSNEILRQRFDEDWQQSGISVQIRVLDNSLLVQVINTTNEFTSFAERSDGLRQFVALQAFTTGSSSQSQILLVDEADQKLHYDAQADLVQMLARQEVAGKVIFTTHSAGCLPEDMGNGVRLVRPMKSDESRSEIVNRFWAENEPGFAPLLYGMGASTLAFFPTRNAVMVEGPSDMLLLPTMFREALGVDVLGFQFVPGLSEATEELGFHAPAIGLTSGILFLTDADPGGEKIRADLHKRGVSKDRLFALGTKGGNCEEVEDFISATILVTAANALLEKYHTKASPLKASDVGEIQRMAALEREFKKRTGVKLPKVDFAYEILAVQEMDPTVRLIDAKRRPAIKAVANAILKRFQKASQARQ